jgi:hypothetical protein
MPKFSFILSRRVFFSAPVPLGTVSTTDFDLKFEFERYLAVYRGINHLYRYRCPAV